MKRLAILIVLTVCLPAPTRADVVLTPLKAEATRGPNRLRNAGFEAHADGKPTGWTSHTSGAPGASGWLQIATSSVKSQRQRVKLSLT